MANKQSLKLNDPIYGKLTITEPVLIELVQSKALQRLKGIHQNGANYFLWEEARQLNRFDHCVGVMLLLRKLGASLEEQIAGLLHDVAHSAFSHVLDYLLGNRNHGSADQLTLSFVTSTDIPKILKKHGYDYLEIFNHNNHHLLEQPLPALCADRIDYFLRDGLGYGALDNRDIQKISNALVNHKNRIVTTQQAIAKLIGEQYLEMDRSYWASSKDSLAINYALVEILRRAIGLGILQLEDLWKFSDDEIIKLLRQAGDEGIDHWFEIMTSDSLILEDRNFYHVRVVPKIRVLDPEILVNGTCQRLSELDADFAKDLAAAHQFPDELFLRFHQ